LWGAGCCPAGSVVLAGWVSLLGVVVLGGCCAAGGVVPATGRGGIWKGERKTIQKINTNPNY
jgi:hypothetical protein